MKKIKFSLNPIAETEEEKVWDKLKPGNRHGTFTTFRGYEWRKMKYYIGAEGQRFEVILDGKKIGTAILMECGLPRAWQVSVEEIEADTIKGYGNREWRRLMNTFYGFFDGLVLIRLKFMWDDKQKVL